MTVAFGLSRKLDSPRIAKVNQYGRWFDHTFRVASPEELDDEVLGWLREAYKVGKQQHLAPEPAST
jgi:hypothetical protein